MTSTPTGDVKEGLWRCVHCLSEITVLLFSASQNLPVDTVLTLQVRHAGGRVDREAKELLRLQLVFLLPQVRQEVPACHQHSSCWR